MGRETADAADRHWWPRTTRAVEIKKWKKGNTFIDEMEDYLLKEPYFMKYSAHFLAQKIVTKYWYIWKV